MRDAGIEGIVGEQTRRHQFVGIDHSGHGRRGNGGQEPVVVSAALAQAHASCIHGQGGEQNRCH